MITSYDTQLADILLKAGKRAGLAGEKEIDAAMLLREAGECAGLPVPAPLPDGESLSRPRISEAVKECLDAAVSDSPSGVAGVREFLLALCRSSRIEDELFAAAGVSDRGALLDRMLAEQQEKEQKEARHRAADSVIGRNGRDLTALAKAGKLHMPLMRDTECAQTINILCRMEKGNPILLGEAGTGKTAIAEGVACLVASGNVPQTLRGARVIEISASAFTDAFRKGAGEEFVRWLAKEILADDESGERSILFVDELHILLEVGAMSEFLKPFLARGGFRMIGATTFKEYRRFIERDEAFSRRFAPVHVEEFTPEQAIKVITGRLSRLEAYHGVRITPEAAEASVRLSHRYIPHRRLPDKALDILDTACVLALSGGEVTQGHIKAAVASAANLPVEAVSNSFLETCKGLSKRLSGRVKGQRAAVGAVSRLLKRCASGLGGEGNRPLGSFLFAGSTGTGKTELAKAVAESFFGREDKMIRLDMSEYCEPSAVNRLIGSSPGYVGSEQGGVLTEAIRKNPFSLILVDEIEKAAPQVVKLFLQILDEGRLSDASGNSFDFRNALIVFTTNAGAHEKRSSIGFLSEGEQKEQARETLRENMGHVFPREFLGRFDEVIHFDDLDERTLRRIVALQLIAKKKALKGRGITLHVKGSALYALARQAAGSPSGGREVRRLLNAKVYDPLADLMAEGTANELLVTVSRSSPETIVVEAIPAQREEERGAA